MKKAFILLANALALIAALVPFALRRRLWLGLMAVESRIGQPGGALRRLFALWDSLDLVINERATAYGNGVNPKHRLTGYHDFFVDNIPAGSLVLDVGCGIGAVARSIAARVKGSKVTAIDFDQAVIGQAKAQKPLDNLTFLLGDAACHPVDGHFDVIVLSNVLEHVKDRKGLLDGLLLQNTPKCLLIRVPLFERHWQMPLRKELGINYFSDPTHHVEHTLAEFEQEMAKAGLKIIDRQTSWGEIWARCEPIK